MYLYIYHNSFTDATHITSYIHHPHTDCVLTHTFTTRPKASAV